MKSRPAPTASRPTRSRHEWVSRYVAWLVEATTHSLSVEEACVLGQHEYELAYDMSPEAAAARLLLGRDAAVEAAEECAAGYSAAILLGKVASRGFRPAR